MAERTEAPAEGSTLGRLKGRAATVGYLSGWRLVRLLPARAAYGLFRRIADVAWRRQGKGVLRLQSNLARVVGKNPSSPEVLELGRAAMRSYLRYYCDTFRLPDWSAQHVVSRVRTEHEERLRDNLASGRGVVGALAHMGNWDTAGAWASVTGAPVTTVAERLRPEELYEAFLDFRQSLGMEIIPLSGGASDVFHTLVVRARDARLVPLLADRDLTANGVPVTFFGAPATLPPGPAALALTSKAALLPITIWYEGKEPDHRIVIHFGEEVRAPEGVYGSARVQAMMQEVARAFEAKIAEHPEDWHMLQRVWT